MYIFECIYIFLHTRICKRLRITDICMCIDESDICFLSLSPYIYIYRDSVTIHSSMHLRSSTNPTYAYYTYYHSLTYIYICCTCTHAYLRSQVHAYIRLPLSPSLHVCMYVCMHACMYVCMYVWMHACMLVCIYVCFYGPGRA